MIINVSNTKEPYFEGVKIRHPCYTLRLVLSGNGHLNINQQTIPLAPGVIVCTPPYMEQQGFSEDGIEEIVIYLTEFPLGQKEGPKILVMKDNSLGFGQYLFPLLLNIFIAQQRNVFLSHYIANIYKCLYQYLESQYVQSTHDVRIVDITAKLENAFTQPDLSIDKILSIQGYNADYLRRLFKKTHGCTPVQYLNRLRIGKAKNLIEGNCLYQRSITQIAAESGFSDHSYFSRVFREHIGLSPTQYSLLFPGMLPPNSKNK